MLLAEVHYNTHSTLNLADAHSLLCVCVGIRPYPYSADFAKDPQTYGFINRAGYNLDSQVHAKGSVWCTILFEGLLFAFIFWLALLIPSPPPRNSLLGNGN